MKRLTEMPMLSNFVQIKSDVLLKRISQQDYKVNIFMQIIFLGWGENGTTVPAPDDI
jgi:hypothetical protein